VWPRMIFGSISFRLLGCHSERTDCAGVESVHFPAAICVLHDGSLLLRPSCRRARPSPRCRLYITASPDPNLHHCGGRRPRQVALSHRAIADGGALVMA
jgi:hypothetical protein